MKKVIFFTIFLGIATLLVTIFLSFQHPVKQVKVSNGAVVGITTAEKDGNL